jgi:hypothetical protein
MQLEGLGQVKNPMTLLGIELATFQHVSQFLKKLRYRVRTPDNPHAIRFSVNIWAGIVVGSCSYLPSATIS